MFLSRDGMREGRIKSRCMCDLCKCLSSIECCMRLHAYQTSVILSDDSE